MKEMKISEKVVEKEKEESDDDDEYGVQKISKKGPVRKVINTNKK